VNKISTKIWNFIIGGGGAQFSSLSQLLKTLVIALVRVTVAFLELKLMRNSNNNLVIFCAIQQHKICEVENVIGNECRMVIQYAGMFNKDDSHGLEQE
jgi:hypothetical protein